MIMFRYCIIIIHNKFPSTKQLLSFQIKNLNILCLSRLAKHHHTHTQHTQPCSVYMYAYIFFEAFRKIQKGLILLRDERYIIHNKTTTKTFHITKGSEQVRDVKCHLC